MIMGNEMLKCGKHIKTRLHFKFPKEFLHVLHLVGKLPVGLQPEPVGLLPISSNNTTKI